MMKTYKYFLFILIFTGFLTACSNDDEEFVEPVSPDPDTGEGLELENFIYRTMSDIYLYKDDVEVLEDNYFASEAERNDFLRDFSSPEDLFERLMASQDRFSYLIEDYNTMNRMADGTSTTTGMSYGLVSYCPSCTEVFGYVRLVLPNTSASEQGVERGMIFNRVDGEDLTTTNFSRLLTPTSFTIGLAEIEGNTIRNLDQTIELTSRQYVKNPVLVSTVLSVEGRNVGYINYDSFTADFDEDLNAAFGELQAAGVEDLILDLRYNGGGSVRTATDLASMITGQFPGEVFMKEQWNAKYQAHYEQNDPASLLNTFNTQLTTGTAINSLNLGRVFVLTTKTTASASELIINGLEPYIDVIHIGDNTAGKFQASAALYDSPNYSKDHSALNTSHTYAVQPLILKSLNANDVSDYVDGLEPDIKLLEDVRNLGTLGDANEPLTRVALDYITGNRGNVPDVKTYPGIGESDMFNKDYQSMYIDTKKLPAIKK